MNRNQKSSLSWGLAGLVLLGWVTASPAQMQTGGAMGGGGGGLGGAGGGLGAGGGASGGGQAFQGGQALQGGLGALGQEGGAGQTGSFTQQLTPGSSSGYGTTSFLGPYYANPLSIGIPSSNGNTGSSGGMGSSKPTFGQALYKTSSSGGQFGSTSGGSNFGSRQSSGLGASGTSGSGGTRSGTTSQSRTTSRQGSSTLGGSRTSSGNIGGQGSYGGGVGSMGGSMANNSAHQAIAYQTTMGYPVQMAVPARVRADLQQVIARTSALPSRAGIQTLAQGEGVVLRGTVGSEQERRLTEAIVRLTPGVFDIRNELTVRETAPAPKPAP